MAAPHVYVLIGPEGEELKLTLEGKRLVAEHAENVKVNELPSEKFARAKLEAILEKRQAAGWILTDSRNEEPEPKPEPKDESLAELEYARTGERLTVTLRGDRLPASGAKEIADRLAAEAPVSVQLICDFASPGKAFGNALADKQLPSLRAFIFDTHFQSPVRQQENTVGDLAAIAQACPNLEQFFATGSSTLGALKHEKLRALVLLGDPLPKAVLTGLGKSELPALETLGVMLGSETAPHPSGPLLKALKALRAPKLQTLALSGMKDPAGLLADLDSPLPASWRTLILDAPIDDEDALLAVLEHHRETLRNLSKLGLAIVDYLSEDAEAKSRELVPSLATLDDSPDLLSPALYKDW